MSGYEKIRQEYLIECFIRRLERISGITQPVENREEIRKFAKGVLDRPGGTALLTGSNAYDPDHSTVVYEGLCKCKLPEMIVISGRGIT